MKSTYLAFLFAFGAIPATAAPLVYEGFDYPLAANLSNQINPSTTQPWLRPSAPTGATQVTTAAAATYPGLKYGTGNALLTPRGSAANNSANRLTLPGRPYNRASESTLFFSFQLTLLEWDAITDALAKGTTPRRGNTIAGFHGGVASTSTAMSSAPGFAAPLQIRREVDYSVLGTDGTAGAQTNKYELGILKTNATPTAGELEASYDQSQSFSVGDTIFVVGQYQFVNDGTGTGDIARLWINPTPGNLLAEATPTIVAPVTLGNLGGTLGLESFYLYAHTNSPGDIAIDEVRIGATFASVTPAVPEPSTIALCGMGLALGATIRRRG